MILPGGIDRRIRMTCQSEHLHREADQAIDLLGNDLGNRGTFVPDNAVDDPLGAHPRQSLRQQIADAAGQFARHQDQHPLSRLDQGAHAVTEKIHRQLQVLAR